MKKSKDLQPGDPISHKNSSLSWCLDAVILRQSTSYSSYWKVAYTNRNGVETEGEWSKSRCVYRSIHTTAFNVPISELKNVTEETLEEQGLPKPDVDKYEKKSNGDPKLAYYQALYSWRGYNGLGHKFNCSHYDPALTIATKAHLLIEDEIVKQLKDNMANCSHKYTHKLEKKMKSDIQEVFINGVLVDTFVNDKNVKDMGPSDFLCQIGNAEEAIKKLSKHEGKSIFAVQEVKRLTAFVTSQYVLLDKMHAEDATPKK